MILNLELISLGIIYCQNGVSIKTEKMNSYSTVSEALNDLGRRGYTVDFSLSIDDDCIYCHANSHSLSSDEFVIDEVYRFEGDSDPGDEMVLFAISSLKDDIKGTLLNAYGVYSDANNSRIVDKLRLRGKNMRAPIKRAKELVQLSRDHHHALVLCWKIRAGISKNIDVNRIRRYVDWFYTEYLAKHFEFEEKFVFPLLGELNANGTKALGQHREIERIIHKDHVIKEDLIQLERLLNDHIRFEERVLFNEVQQLESIKDIRSIDHSDPGVKFCENESDPFWK